MCPCEDCVGCREAGLTSQHDLNGYTQIFVEQRLPECEHWLTLRLKPLRAKWPHLKFQLTKLMQLPLQGSYPTYVAHLCAPFVIETGSALTGDLHHEMIDARAPIKMTKADLNNKERAEVEFRKRRIAATHILIGFVEDMSVPCRSDGQVLDNLKPSYWGTLADLFPDKYGPFSINGLVGGGQNEQ